MELLLFVVKSLLKFEVYYLFILCKGAYFYYFFIIIFWLSYFDFYSITDAFVRITVEKSALLYHVSSVVGWLYFLAWSVSFYPQILSNYRRKSVVGLNFDFLSLNLVGFVLYSLFNCGLYWIPEIEVNISVLFFKIPSIWFSVTLKIL